jgi:hypothetical protein
VILSLFSSPSEIFSKIQDKYALEEIQYISDVEKDDFIIWETKYGPVQIKITEYVKNRISINPIPGKTSKGWENLIPLIYDQDRKMMAEIIERFEDYSQLSARELMQMDEDDF